MSELLKEAFKELAILNEDTFSFDNEGVFKLDRFIHYDDIAPDVIEVIDPEAETEEDLQSQYDGKAILKCCVCGQLIYKDPEEVVVDQDLSRANVEEECPHCQLSGGFEVVGQVAPYVDEDSTKVEVDGESVEIQRPSQEDRDEPDSEDSLTEDFKVGQRYQLGDSREFIIVDTYNTPGTPREACEVLLAELMADGEQGDDISLSFAELAKGLKSGKYIFLGEDLKLEEDFQKATIESGDTVLSMETTEEGKITVTSEPRKPDDFGDEMVVPVDAELRDQIEADPSAEEVVDEEPEEVVADVEEEVTTEEGSTETLEEPSEEIEPEAETALDIDELDEDSFNELGESYFKRVYDNVNSFQVIGGSIEDNKFLVEGLITFNSGKQAKTRFLFEGVAIDRHGRLKFLGENAHLSHKKGAFTIKGIAEGSKLIAESFTYNYRAVDSKTGKGYSLYGTIKR